MMLATIAMTIAISVQASASQPQDLPSTAAQPQTEQAGEDKVICKRVTTPGTRFKERKCAYASEWKKQERRYVETTRELKGNRGSFKGG